MISLLRKVQPVVDDAPASIRRRATNLSLLRRDLGRPLQNLASEQDVITRALDILLTGV